MTTGRIHPSDWQQYGPSVPVVEGVLRRRVRMRSPEPSEDVTGSVNNLAKVGIPRSIGEAQNRGEPLSWGIIGHSETPPTEVTFAVQTGGGSRNELTTTFTLTDEKQRIVTDPVTVTEPRGRVFAWAEERSEEVVLRQVVIGNPGAVERALTIGKVPGNETTVVAGAGALTGLTGLALTSD